MNAQTSSPKQVLPALQKAAERFRQLRDSQLTYQRAGRIFEHSPDRNERHVHCFLHAMRHRLDQR
ncbi:hypothetical protein KGP36_03590 [Patescibacteria group bacterium]|nr:hypothetical protein [Patescibacteria group bacterium]MDE1941028.1 hypothetical protein [Patescibacteria group bacterium]